MVAPGFAGGLPDQFYDGPRGQSPYGRDDVETWYGVRILPLPVDERGEQHALLLTTDITPSRHAEDALRESEARFRMLTENSPDFVAVMRRLDALLHATLAGEDGAEEGGNGAM